MTHPILKARGITKSFTKPRPLSILSGVDLDIHAGETVAITGRSGEGKSTLLQILGTLDDATSGSLEITGRTVSSKNKSLLRNRHIAFIFQSFHLMDDYTALENVLLPASIARQPTHKGSAAYTHALTLLEQVGLHERAHFQANVLSGGEKQRVAIARALCNSPDLILADEPTGNLDSETARQIHNLLLRSAHDLKKAVVIVTHDTHLASLCDTRYRLEDGLVKKT